MSYRGSYVHNQRCGEGTMIYANGKKFAGAWQDGVRCGTGRMEYLNGDVYEGEWHHDVRHGQGTLYLADGDVYQGDWCDDQRHGQVKFDVAFRQCVTVTFLQGTHFYVKHLKRYDGVWQLDVPKCGMYGALDHGDGQQCAVVLPSLELHKPLDVLGDCARDLLQQEPTAATSGN